MNIKQTEVIIGEDKFIFYSDAKIVSYENTNVNETLNNLFNNSYLVVEASGVNSYTGSNSKIKSLNKYTRFTLFVAANSTGNCTINLNNFGAKNIKDCNGNIVTDIKANIPYNLMYNGTDFILQGKGGGGKSFSTQYTINPWLYVGSNIPESNSEKVVLYDNKIYCIGRNSTNIKIYDVLNNIWSNGAQIPHTVYDPVVEEYNGKIYIISGAYDKNNVQIYDIKSNIWTIGHDISYGGVGMSSAVVNGKIYCIGGDKTGNVTSYMNYIQIYDIANNEWNLASSAIYKFYGSTSIAYNNKIYCMGGVMGSNPINFLQIYDITANKWFRGVDMPTPRFGCSSVLYNDNIYCLGGCDAHGGYYFANEKYNITSNSWTIKTDMPTGKMNMGCVVYDNKIFTIGGYNNFKYIDKVEIYDIKFE